MPDTDHAARAAAGAAWLDEHRPDWVHAFVDDMAAGLEMASCTTCVLGYVFGHYRNADLFAGIFDRFADPAGVNLWLRAEAVPDLIVAERRAAQLGFTEAGAAWEYRYDLLGDAWRDLIGKRLADDGLLAG